MKTKGSEMLDSRRYVLILNKYPLYELAVPAFEPNRHALDFLLAPASKDSFSWRTLLGAPTTLHQTFSVAIGAAFTARDAVAPSVFSALTLQFSVNDGASRVDSIAIPASTKLGELIRAPLNHLQAALTDMIAQIPIRRQLGIAVAAEQLVHSVPPTTNLSVTYALSRLRLFLDMQSKKNRNVCT